MLGKTAMFKASAALRVGAALAMAAAVGFVAGRLAVAREPAPRQVKLMSSGMSVAGENIAYPAAVPAHVTAAILTLQPGEETGWHTHGVPVFGYMLEGELTVFYAGQQARTFKAGEALLEAINVAHNGRNSGQGPMRILAVFMGAEGMPVSVAADAQAAEPAQK